MFHFWISLCVGAIRSHSNGYSWTWLIRSWLGNLSIRDHEWTIITICSDTEKRDCYSALFFLDNVWRVRLSGSLMFYFWTSLCVCANRLDPNWYLCTRLVRSCNLEVPRQSQYHESWMRAAFKHHWYMTQMNNDSQFLTIRDAFKTNLADFFH